MKAMILAAGMGTRLLPLTENKPKALVEINGIPLVQLAIQKLISSGFDEIIINAHHFAGMLINFLKEKNNFGINIQISDETDLLLDTGGGIKQASSFFNDGKAFLVYNVDILSDIDLRQLYRAHCELNPIATLAVRNRETSRYLLFNEENILCGWKNFKSGSTKFARPSETVFKLLAYSGIQIVNPKIFNLMPEDKVFSIIDLYLKLAVENEIKAYIHDDSFWMDLGKPESLKEAEKIIDDVR